MSRTSSTAQQVYSAGRNTASGPLSVDSAQNRRSLVLTFCLFVFTVVLLQWASGAYHAEFSGDADEAAHYVTGLMVRDYIAGLAPQPPMQFAENYYLHYPKVALGHWPPVFYVVQSAWTLLFGPSRGSVVFLMALLTALVAMTLYVVLRKEFSAGAGIAGGLMLISLPVVQRFTGSIMAEMLIALLALWGVLLFARYLDTERWQDSAAFGLVASLAILTKGTGFVFATVPPLAILLARRFRLVFRFSFWLPALMVLALCAPWYFLAPVAMHQSVAWGGGIHPGTGRVGPPIWILLPQLAGYGAVLFISAGFLARIVSPVLQRRDVSAIWASAAAMVLSFVLLRYVISAARVPKHMTLVAPVLLLFLAAGVDWLARRMPMGTLRPRRNTIVLAAVVGIVFLVEAFTVPKKLSYGFAEAARDLISKPEFDRSVILVSSEAIGEGCFTAEVAMRERRPGHFVLRASKVLAKSNWTGYWRELYYSTPAALMDYLTSVPVGILVIDSQPSRRPVEYHRLLKEVVRIYSNDWRLIGSYPQQSETTVSERKILVYRFAGQKKEHPPSIRIDMSERLNKVLVFNDPTTVTK